MELKPCPFCGGEVEIERYGNSRQSTIYHCLDCGCALETGEEHNHGYQWNTRADIDKAVAEARSEGVNWERNRWKETFKACGIMIVDGLSYRADNIEGIKCAIAKAVGEEREAILKEFEAVINLYEEDAMKPLLEFAEAIRNRGKK